MNDALQVRVLQCLRHLDDDVDLLYQAQWSAGLNHAIKRLAIEELHDDERIAFVLAEFVHHDDVGVLEHADCAGFTQQTLAAIGGVGKAAGDDLYRHHAAEVGVARLVHHAHAAAANPLEDLVFSDPFRSWHLTRLRATKVYSGQAAASQTSFSPEPWE